MKSHFGVKTWILTLISICLISGCAGVRFRLQSKDQTINELSKSMQRDARQECEKNVNPTEYMTCVERVNKTYEKIRQEQQKPKP